MDGGFRRLKLSSSTNNTNKTSYNNSGTRDALEAQPLRNAAPRKSEIERAVFVGNNKGLLRKVSTSRTDTQTVGNYNRTSRTTITPEENVPCPVLICRVDHEHNWQEGCYMMVRLSTQQLARRASEAAIQGGYEDLPEEERVSKKGSFEDLQESDEPMENPDICNAVGPAWTYGKGTKASPLNCDPVPPAYGKGPKASPVNCDPVSCANELPVDPVICDAAAPPWTYKDADKPTKKVEICDGPELIICEGEPFPCEDLPPDWLIEKEKKRKEKMKALAGIMGFESDDERLEMYLSTDEKNTPPAAVTAETKKEGSVDTGGTVKTRRASVGLFRGPDGELFCPLGKDPTPEEEGEEKSERTEEIIQEVACVYSCHSDKTSDLGSNASLDNDGHNPTHSPAAWRNTHKGTIHLQLI